MVSSPPPSPAASLREEQRLLDLARDAIVRGEPEAALPPTSTHAARFPQGVLSEERDALRIRALARLGRGDEARALLARMRVDHPHSFLLDGAGADAESIP
jgi:pentatricopeptide repeat protein